MYDEKDCIGIYATDEEAYKVFEDLFTPIIKDIHPGYEVKSNFKHEMELVSIKNLQNLLKIKTKLPFIKVSARRNFKDYPFTPMMSTQTKFHLEKKVIEAIGKDNGEYKHLSKLDDETKTWLEKVGININVQKAHDSAGINDDWPNGRGIFIDDNKSFAILVNFEDHIQVFTISEEGDLSSNLKNLTKILSNFEKLGFANSPSLGFLTASPKHLGTAMEITARLRLKTKHTENDLASFGKQHC